jgi:putative ABC transport system permease protein
MELTTLILKNVMRHKLRSILTILGIAIAISAFGLLRTVLTAWYGVAQVAAPNRLVTRNAISLIFPLPLSYKDAILSIPGVEKVSYGSWFQAIYIDERHSQFAQFAVDPATWFDLYPEYLIADEQKEAFLRERNAAIIGIELAERFGWKIGDTIRMRGTIHPGDWDFVIRGIYSGAQEAAHRDHFFFHWQYLDERLRQTEPWRAGHVGMYEVKITDPELAGTVAQAIDERFKNSLAETLTETEKAFLMGFVTMSQAILTALEIISVLIIGVILLVLFNTMAMTARERLSEYAVLKTLGFGAPHLTFLIAGESLLIALSGGVLGMSFIYPATGSFVKVMGEMMGVYFPIYGIAPATLAASGLMAIGVGLTAAVFPTWRAVTLRIAEGLRRVG